MFAVESYAAVRRFVFVEGRSRREAARVFGLSRETVSKMCRFWAPPGYVRARPAAKPKLGPLIGVVEAIRLHGVKDRHRNIRFPPMRQIISSRCQRGDGTVRRRFNRLAIKGTNLMVQHRIVS